jgi:hypothetical protein
MAPKFCKGDPVRVRGCTGSARVEKVIRKYGVVLLDRPMVVSKWDLTFWTFEPDALTKIEPVLGPVWAGAE